ncbi:glycosyltransferase family 2 protein [Campylobacter sp. FOBRC14]|uniref:glycosyltransferase family 2 protein n=2 Tax=Campylobacter TaxID=194 RepID=UPI00027A3797|nr:glycosyltransferase family 21 [Campylobacter sp. FOBRC14]
MSVIAMSERGTSLGRNTGAKNAKYERLVFLDADDRIKPDFLEKSLAALQKSGLWVAGGQIWGGENLMTRLGIGIFNLGMLITQYFFPTCTDACIFSTKTAHEHIGGFDTRIKLCEDCDYVNRASKTFRFRMLAVKFRFNARRLEQDGLFKMGALYLRANVRRLIFDELLNDEIKYPFAHYREKQ